MGTYLIALLLLILAVMLMIPRFIRYLDDTGRIKTGDGKPTDNTFPFMIGSRWPNIYAVVGVLALIAAIIVFAVSISTDHGDSRSQQALQELADNGLSVRKLNTDTTAGELTVTMTNQQRCALPVQVRQHNGRWQAYYYRESTGETILVTYQRAPGLAEEAGPDVCTVI